MNQPKISVLMSVYNGEDYLKESIESVLNQSFKNFEFIIVDDGSVDNTLRILKSYKDERIKIIENKENLGLATSLNTSMKLATGKYIARMDADDISLTNRFEKQIAFLEENPEVDICGTYIKTFGGKREVWKPPTTHNEIVSGLFFESTIYHPTVFFRMSSIVEIDKLYNESFNKAQDYELWVRLMSLNKVFANLPEVLLKYRVQNKDKKKKIEDFQERNSEKIRTGLLSLFVLVNQQNTYQYELLRQGRSSNIKNLEETYALVRRLKKINLHRRIFDKKSFNRLLDRKFFKLCYNSSNQGLVVWRFFNNKRRISNSCKISTIKKLKFVLKCILRK